MQIKSISLVFIVLFCTLASFAQTKMTTTGGTYRLVTSEKQIDNDGLYLVAHKTGTSIYLMSTKPSTGRYFASYKCNNTFETIPNSIIINDDINIVIPNNYNGLAYEYRILAKEGGIFVLEDINDYFLQNSSTDTNETTLSKEINDRTKFTINLRENSQNPYRWDISNSSKVLKYYQPSSGNNTFTFINSTSSGASPYLYKRISSTASLTISAAGYASLFYGKYDVILPAGLQAFTYTESNGELSISHTYIAGDRIPAGTAVIIKGAAGDYDITICEPDNNLESPSNVLKGYDTTKETSAEGSNKYYMLSLNESEELSSVGFYYGADNGAAFESGAHRAFLALPSSNSAKPTSFRFSNIEKNNVITDIKRRNNEAPSTLQYFDIQGRKAINHAPSQKARKKTNKGIIIIH